MNAVAREEAAVDDDYVATNGMSALAGNETRSIWKTSEAERSENEKEETSSGLSVRIRRLFYA